METCTLCYPQNETVLWRDRLCRVILANDADYPGFCRVVWQVHAQEMTDLNAKAREHLLRVVFAVEQALRDLLAPDKINLASFGNQVPHLHWHVIPRFRDDAHFPDSVWSVRQRDGQARAVDVAALTAQLWRELGSGLAAS